MREKAKCGDFVFYEPFPDTKPYKQNTLIGANVKVENLNFYDRDKESYITEKEFYKAFYNEVANDICLKMKHRSAAD